MYAMEIYKKRFYMYLSNNLKLKGILYIILSNGVACDLSNIK